LIWLSLSHNSIFVGFGQGAGSPASARQGGLAAGPMFFNKWWRNELLGNCELGIADCESEMGRSAGRFFQSAIGNPQSAIEQIVGL
jgi:hypothetical protein